MSKSVYLAGGMKSNWQDQIVLPDGVEVFDPRKSGLPDPADYTRWDLEHVARADFVIAQMAPDNPSGYGVSVEIGFAYALRKPIIFVDQIGPDWRSRYFDMHRQMATVVVPSLEAASSVLGEWICRDCAPRSPA